MRAAASAPASAEAAAKELPRTIDVVAVARLRAADVPCREKLDPWELAQCVGEVFERRASPRIWPKAASRTIRDGWGNDVDLAVVCAALLRLQGHPAENVAVQLSANPGHACVYLARGARGSTDVLLIDPYLAFIGPQVERAWRLEGSDQGTGMGAGAGIVTLVAGANPLVALGCVLFGAGAGEDKGAALARSKVYHVATSSKFVAAFNDRLTSTGFDSTWTALAAHAELRDEWQPLSPLAGVTNLDTMNEGIVAFGDSLTRYKGGETDYPTHLSRLLGVPIVNHGRMGDTAANAWTRIQQVQALRPRLTIVCLGGNDLMEGVDPSTTEQQLDAIVQALQNAGSIVAIVAYEPLFPRAEWSARYDRLARERGVVLLPDVWRDIQGTPSLTLDRVHPNSAGALKAAQALAPGVEEILRAAQGERVAPSSR